jgi:hypothetical protein
MPKAVGEHVAKSKSYTTYETCPKCASRDVRGPVDTAAKEPNFHFVRTWFCRTCWWSTAINLYDDAAFEKAMTARKPSTRTAAR